MAVMKSILKCAQSYLCCLVLFIIFRVDLAAGCPKVCECKWKHGKVWVICTNANFIDVPQGLDSATQVLDLSKNNLKILFRDAFIDRGLINLQKVFLVNCQLRKIDKHSLRRLANLVELNLAYNLLSELPVEVLGDIPGLRELRLQRNNITYVPQKAFEAVPELVHLDLSFNSIKVVEETAFSALSKLEVLKLNGNKIKTIRKTLLEPLLVLYELQLHANLWDCNCLLRPALEWVREKNFAVSTFPKCWTPAHLQNKFWHDVEPEKLVCVPKVTSLASRILAMNGDNVTLTCKIETEADAKITWMVKNKHLTNDSHPSDDQRYNVLEMVTINRKNQTTVSNLTISQADFDDEGIYRCVVENDAGRVETNLTLQVSEAIKEDQLVANDGDYLVTGAILGGVVALVVMCLVLCLSIILYKRKAAQSSLQNNKNIEKVSCQMQREFSPASVHPPPIEIVSPSQKCSCPQRGDPENPSVFLYKNNELPQFARVDNQTLDSKSGASIPSKSSPFLKKFSPPNNGGPSIEKGTFDISFVEVPEVPLQFQDQPNTGNGSGPSSAQGNFLCKRRNDQYPDVLRHQTPSYCTLYRNSRGSFHSTFEGRRGSSIRPDSGGQQDRLNLQASRSSSCLHSSEGTQGVNYHTPVSPCLGRSTVGLQGTWTVKPSYSLESVNHEAFPINSSSRGENLPMIESEGLREMCSTPLHGVQCGINSLQLQRILQEYAYMKEELHRLKEAQKIREQREQEEQGK